MADYAKVSHRMHVSGIQPRGDHLLILDDYEMAHLRRALQMAMDTSQWKMPGCGDWVGQIRWALDSAGDVDAHMNTVWPRKERV